MSSLQDIQARFLDYLVSDTPLLESDIAEPRSGSLRERMQVYAEGYKLRLAEAMADSYPALHGLLGDDVFFKLCYDYIDAHPSPYFSIRYYGEKLAQFIGEQGLYSEIPLVEELARFEWCLREVFDAADAVPVTAADLRGIGEDQWPGLGVMFHSTARRITLHWNTPQVWQHIENDQAPPSFELQPKPIMWLLWRADLKIPYRSLDEDEAWAMACMADAKTFGDVCDGLAQWHNEDAVAMRAAQLLMSWISSGLISQLVIPPHPS